MKALIVLGSGGHTKQMLLLEKDLKMQKVFLISKEDNWSPRVCPGKNFFVNVPKKNGENVVFSVFRTLRTTFQSFFVLLKSNPDVVISAGPGVGVPISLLAKLFRKKVIFVESWSRIWNPSASGKIMYNFADLFFVQWPEMKKEYPKAVFAGRLL